MAIGTPVVRGTARLDSPGTTVNTTATVTANAGECIFGWVNLGVTSSSPTISDGTANVYTFTSVFTWGSGGRMWFFYCANPVALSSATFTLSWTTSNRCSMNVNQCSGLSTTTPFDINPTGATGTNAGMTSPLASGTLSQADELLCAATSTNGAVSSFLHNGSWTGLTANTGGGNTELRDAYQIVSALSSVDYQSTWTTSRIYGAKVVSLKAPGSGSSGGTLSMMGV